MQPSTPIPPVPDEAQAAESAETVGDLRVPAPTEAPPNRPLPAGGAARRQPAARRAQIEVPGYDILSELGRGGMGVVYRARQHGLNRLVALKMVLAGGHASADQLARFRAEAQAVARLQHRNIVQIYEIGEHDGLPFFSLEFCPGGTLESKLDGTPWHSRQAALVVEVLAQAIEVAHRAGIVHRDLKPANVLLALAEPAHGVRLGSGSRADDGKSYELKITDFGLAKKLGEAGQTQSGAILGTPSYMAPEQAAGHNAKAIGPATDVYALGAILYELLTGRPPFVASTPLETVFQVVEREPVPPSQLRPGMDKDLETICLKCLQKEPAKRYASATELADDLRRYREAEPIRARPTPALVRAWKWMRRHKALTGLIVVSVLGILAGIGAAVWYEVDLRRRDAENNRQLVQEVEAAKRGERAAVLAKNVVAAEKDLLPAKAAFAGGEWEKADELVKHVRERLGAEPEFAAVRQDVEKLERELSPHLADRAAAKEAARQLQQFESQYNDALAQVFLFPGDDPGVRRRQIQKQAEEALALYPLNQAEGKLADQYSSEQKRGLQRSFQVLQTLKTQAAATASAGADNEFLRGLDFYEVRNYEHAVSCLEHALEIDPNQFWPRYFLAICYLQLNQWRLAKVNLDVLLRDREPAAAWVELLRGHALSQLNEFNQAEEAFNRADAELKNRGDDRAAYAVHVYRGAMYARQAEVKAQPTPAAEKLVQAAADEFRAAIQLRSDIYLAYQNLAAVYGRQHQLKPAVTELGKAIARCRESSVIPRLYFDRAALLRQQADATVTAARRQLEDQALADLKVVRRAAAKDVPLVMAAYVEQGQILQRRGDYEQALTAYKAALAIKGGNPTAEHLKAQTLQALHRFEEAIVAYSVCLELGKDPDLYRERALAWFQLGQYAKAIEDFTSALQLSETIPPRKDIAAAPSVWKAEVLAGRGWAHVAGGQLRSADADFREAVKFDEAANLPDKNIYALLGSIYVQVKQAVSGAALEAALTKMPKKLLNEGELPSGSLYTAARIYGVAAGKPFGPSREYQKAAAQLLRDALHRLPEDQRLKFWQSSVQIDDGARSQYIEPDFKSITIHEDFHLLEQEMERLAAKFKRGRKP